MLSRRSMLRAFGIGAPAAAVAAAIGLPKPASGGYVLSTSGYVVGEAGLETKLPVAQLSAISGEMGKIQADLASSYRATIREAVAEDIAARGPLAVQIERAYSLRRSIS